LPFEWLDVPVDAQMGSVASIAFNRRSFGPGFVPALILYFEVLAGQNKLAEKECQPVDLEVPQSTLE
jgi:hypothetical protein